MHNLQASNKNPQAAIATLAYKYQAVIYVHGKQNSHTYNC